MKGREEKGREVCSWKLDNALLCYYLTCMELNVWLQTVAVIRTVQEVVCAILQQGSVTVMITWRVGHVTAVKTTTSTSQLTGAQVGYHLRCTAGLLLGALHKLLKQLIQYQPRKDNYARPADLWRRAAMWREHSESGVTHGPCPRRHANNDDDGRLIQAYWIRLYHLLSCVLYGQIPA